MTDSPRPARALTNSSVGVSGSASDEAREVLREYAEGGRHRLLLAEDASALLGLIEGLSADVARLTAERDRYERAYRESMAFIPEERAKAAEARVAVLREAAQPFVAHPRFLSIGSEDNTVEIRVSRRAFEALEASLRDAGETKP